MGTHCQDMDDFIHTYFGKEPSILHKNRWKLPLKIIYNTLLDCNSCNNASKGTHSLCFTSRWLVILGYRLNKSISCWVRHWFSKFTWQQFRIETTACTLSRLGFGNLSKSPKGIRASWPCENLNGSFIIIESTYNLPTRLSYFSCLRAIVIHSTIRSRASGLTAD